MLEFVDSDLYFVQAKNNFINPLLQVGSGSGSVEKSTGSSSLGRHQPITILGQNFLNNLCLIATMVTLSNNYFIAFFD